MKSRNLAFVACFFGSLVSLTLPSRAEDWTRFRGTDGNGVSPKPAPVKWSPDNNLAWQVELPGAGASCPIIVGDKVFVTCYSGYGLDRREPGKVEDLKRHLVCIDRANGKTLWERSVDGVTPEDAYTGMGVPEHGYASHTPVSDGKSVFAFFGKSGVHAFDLSGKPLWNTDVGNKSDNRRWGSSSSPILFENLVIVPSIAESSALIALDKESGKEVWRQETESLSGSWSTPLIVDLDDDRSDLVIGVAGEVWGLNPRNGKLRWYYPVPGNSFYTSVSANDGVVYGSVGGRGGGGSFAVRGGGKKDVAESQEVWKGNDQSSYATPVIHDGKMFIVSGGIATAIDAKDGKRIKRTRLEASKSDGEIGGQSDGEETDAEPSRGRRRGGSGGDYSSPVVADGKLYYLKRNGEAYVLTTDGEFKQLAVNRVTEDEEEFSATPAISDGQIFIRSNRKLYCVQDEGKK